MRDARDVAEEMGFPPNQMARSKALVGQYVRPSGVVQEHKGPGRAKVMILRDHSALINFRRSRYNKRSRG